MRTVLSVVLVVAIALGFLAVPAILALATSRGWLPERFWNRPGRAPRTWSRRTRWTISGLLVTFYGGLAAAGWAEGRIDMTILWSLQGLLWGAWPHLMARNAHRRDTDT